MFAYTNIALFASPFLIHMENLILPLGEHATLQFNRWRKGEVRWLARGGNAEVMTEYQNTDLII